MTESLKDENPFPKGKGKNCYSKRKTFYNPYPYPPKNRELVLKFLEHDSQKPGDITVLFLVIHKRFEFIINFKKKRKKN